MKALKEFITNKQKDGYSMNDISDLFGLSRQRLYQLINADPKKCWQSTLEYISEIIDISVTDIIDKG